MATVAINTTPTAICALRDQARVSVSIENTSDYTVVVSAGDSAPGMDSREGVSIPVGATAVIDGNEAKQLIYAMARVPVSVEVTIA